MFDDTTLDLARRLVESAARLGVTVGCAESCTGGLVCAAITCVPGASAVLRGGVVSYAAQVKHDVLGVAEEVIDAPGVGVVSPECACQMAEGARSALGCDVAVSVTGIAGPGGEEPGKPVGTVWFGLATPQGTRAETLLLPGGRDEVRIGAVRHALELLLVGTMEIFDTTFDI